MSRLHRLRRLLFGDRLGVALFLGTLAWVALTWRVGFFITDSYPVANTLVNVADGHLYITRIEYSLTLGSQPGLHVFEGRVYGRNYGQVYLALPVYLLLDALSTVVDLRVLATGGTSLAILGVAHQTGGSFDRRPTAVVAGSVLATALFVGNVAGAAVLPQRWAALLALQTTTALGAGAIAVALYRVLTATSGRRVGVVVAVVAVVGTPLGLWATIPKRHVLTAALGAVALAAFHQGRDGDPRVRGLAYAAVAYAASIHAPEGLVMLALLAGVDVLTVPTVRRRDITVGAVGLAVGIVPFLLTNTLISGNPLLAPRWLPLFLEGTIGPDGFVQAAPGSDGNTTTSTAQTASLLAGGTVLAVSGVLEAILDRVVAVVRSVTDPQSLYHVFVRSGNIPDLRYDKNDFAVIELALFESAPVLPTVLLGVGAVARTLSAPVDGLRRLWAGRTTPSGATDLLATVWLLALTAAYLPNLPLFSQITVRYLLVTLPLWLYLLGRVPAVRTALTDATGWAVGAFGVGASVCAVALVAAFAVVDPALGEAMQLHALVNLAIAGAAVLTAMVARRRNRPELGAVGVGLAGGAGATLVVLAGVVYFPYGPSLLPVTDWLADLLGVL